MQSTTARMKNCVSCQFWAGPRKPGIFRDRVEYGSRDDKGECIGPIWNGREMKALASCQKWEKWSVLK